MLHPISPSLTPWKARLKALGASLALLTLSGCALGSQRYGRVIDPSRVLQVEIGVSNKQDVLDLFGPPTSYSRISAAVGTRTSPPDLEERVPALIQIEVKPAEDVFSYEYREENESFFTALLFTHFQRDTLTDTLMVFFGKEDLVKYVAFAKQTDAQVEPEPEPADGE